MRTAEAGSSLRVGRRVPRGPERGPTSLGALGSDTGALKGNRCQPKGLATTPSFPHCHDTPSPDGADRDFRRDVTKIGLLAGGMSKSSLVLALSASLLVCATFSGCASAQKSGGDEAALQKDEAYVTVQPGVGSRVTRRVKASELHKLREPGQQRAYTEEEMVHVMTSTSAGVPPNSGEGAP
jgi:hypothetical protein